MTFVLDASVTMAWCVEDEWTAPLLALQDRLRDEGGLATSLWPLEAANGLLMAERRGRMTQAQRRRLTSFLRELPVTLDPTTPERAWADAASLAERFRLTVYDATYLELAHRAQLPLATLDRELLAAAPALGVAIIPLTH